MGPQPHQLQLKGVDGMVHGSVHADCARCLRELPAASPLAGRFTRMLGLVSEGRRHAMPTACRDGVACRLSVQQSSFALSSRVCPRYRRTFRPSRGHRRYRVITSNNSYCQHFVVRGRPEERPPWSCGRRPAARGAHQSGAHTVLGPYRLFTCDFRSGIATSRGNATAVVAGRCFFLPSVQVGPGYLFTILSTPFIPTRVGCPTQT